MPNRKNWALLPALLLALSSTGCATNSPPLIVSPAKIPAPLPELVEPEDLSVSYSELVRNLLQTWRQKLTD